MPRQQPREPRLAVAPMYTCLRVRRPLVDEAKTYEQTGFIYDISRTGMRFELDEALEGNTCIECEITLPALKTRLTGDPRRPVTFHATGKVVRIHDDEPGPVRMGLQFGDIADADRQTLETYLDASAAKS